MLDYLKELVNTTNPKGLIPKIKADSQLVDFINQSVSADIALKEKVYLLISNKPVPYCPNNKIPKFKDFTSGYRQYCGVGLACICRQQDHSMKIKSVWDNRSAEEVVRITNNGKHLNTAEVQQKAKKTNQQKYGVEKPFQSKEVQSKAKSTYKKNTGYDSPLHNPAVQNQIQTTHINKYGGLMTHARKALYEKYDGNPFAHPDVKEKIKNHWNTTRLGTRKITSVKQLHLTDEQLEFLQDATVFSAKCNNKSYAVVALETGVDATTIARAATKHGLEHIFNFGNQTVIENRVAQILDNLNVAYVTGSKKLIPPYQLDFYLPDFNIAIEVGSLYWHSEMNAGRSKNYHYNKWKMCKDKGIDLYQWFDDDIRNHWPVIENKIKYVTGNIKKNIGARKCKLSTSANQLEVKALLEENHIQGYVNARQFNLYAYHGDKLVGLMSFSYRKDYVELVRFVTKLGANYPGLFSRMFKHSIKEMNYSGEVISFSNNCHSNGNLYAANGFTMVKELGPAYWYTNDYQTRYNRQNFMKTKIAEKFNIDMSNKTEWQAMQELGYDRVWDAGKLKWSITV